MTNNSARVSERARYARARVERDSVKVSEAKPFKCAGCSYRTADETKFNNHVDKYDKFFSHPDIPSPHVREVKSQ